MIKQVLTVTPTLDTSIYANNDLLFDRIEVSALSRERDGIVVVDSVTLIDKDDQGTAVDLYFSDDSGTWGTFNAAISVTDAIADGVQGVVAVAAADFKDLINNQVAHFNDVGIAIKQASSGSIWVIGAVRSGTPTYTAAGIVLRLGVTVY